MSAGNIVNLIYCLTFSSKQCKQVCRYRIFYKGKIAAMTAISIDNRWFILQQCFNEKRNDGCIRAFRVLPGAKNIKVPKPDKFHIVQAGIYLSIKLVYIFCYGIGRKRITNQFFLFRKTGMVAVSR